MDFILVREKGKKAHDVKDGEVEEEDDVIQQDPETLKNIEELHKIQDSGVGKAVLKVITRCLSWYVYYKIKCKKLNNVLNNIKLNFFLLCTEQFTPK